jgi:hypothetical protein
MVFSLQMMGTALKMSRNDLFNKMKFLEFVIFFYSWVGVFCSMVAYELRFNDNEDG